MCGSDSDVHLSCIKDFEPEMGGNFKVVQWGEVPDGEAPKDDLESISEVAAALKAAQRA